MDEITERIQGAGLFWFWNATPSEDGIQRQLDAFCAKGFRQIYIHPMPETFRREHFYAGMETPYLSEAFFELIAYTCAQVRERGMLLWLYDEGGWPSGMADGQVVAADSRYGVWGLRKCGSEIRPVQFLDEGCVYPDLMNAEATACFVELTHERYRTAVAEEFGRTIPGIFTDEPRILGQLGSDTIPWSAGVNERFERDHGYPLARVIEMLFDVEYADNAVLSARRDYLATLSGLIAENYFAPIGQWCRQNNLLFEGHHTGDDGFARHGRYFGDFFEQARHYDVPGVDTIWRIIFPGKLCGNYVQLAASVARLYGKPAASSESFNVYGAGLTLEQMHWMSAFQIVRGITRISVMPALYSNEGARRIGCCADFSPQNPIWRDIDLLVDSIDAAARFAGVGEADVSVGVFYRCEEISDNDAAERFNAEHEAVCERLHDQMVGFVFVGVRELEDAALEDGKIVLKRVTLKALVVHAALPLSQREAAILEKAMQAGVEVVFVGDHTQPETLGEQRRVATPAELDLGQYAPVIAQGDTKGVRLRLTRGKHVQLLFFNQNPRTVEFAFRFRNNSGDRPLRLVDLEAASAGTLGGAWRDGEEYRLRMEPGAMVGLSSAAGREIPSAPQAPPADTISLPNQWRVREDQRFVIDGEIKVERPSAAEQKTSLGDYCRDVPAFSGTLCYRTTFTFDGGDVRRAVLALGEVWYSAEVVCNGQDCGRGAWGAFCFDVTAALRVGENEVEIRVTNTLANQWARSDVRAADFALGDNPYLPIASPFIDESLHAGLAGPVVLHLYA